MSTHNGVYLFCAIHEKEPKKFGSVQLNGKKSGVYTIHFENVAMVVSKVTGDVLPTRQNLMAHQQKITEVMKQYSVIPMSFGNVFHSKNDVLLVMEHLNEEFEKLFLQLENKIEVGLKVIPKKEWINEEMNNNPLLNQWKAAKKDLADPASFYDQIQVGEQAQNFILRLEEHAAEEIYEPLLEIAEAGKLNKTIPAKTLLNAAFLIDTNHEELFDKKVNELFELWKDKVEFKYSGPWPAYNFVNIVLRIEGNL
ncbi:GvpL/GvpF family gas vesicle protein [Neobacillus sp. DY30]|uniref:GvpL/GvpF family gas vesicle protein n=1 Tax=Neobacillus sp. DY30 TaxID=3047871 RepID=UPI0024BF41F4|nr:GvpL/GvpF family gas vesicle protein [Neobacillus sp. DY30]WHY03017.1 GvpL/GvpF family gas vesicle protein [Neobacillus sp. DY30]